jgi:hypothetical protein
VPSKIDATIASMNGYHAKFRPKSDTNRHHSGDITAEELGEVMKSLGLSPSDSELRDLVAEADVNNDGSIDFPGVSCKSPFFMGSQQLTSNQSFST